MEFKDLLELRKLPVGALVGILIGALIHHWVDRNFWKVELKDACVVGGLVGALLSRFIITVLVDPFIIPLVRQRELEDRLRKCAELRRKRTRLLTLQQWQEVSQKIILDCLLHRKRAEKEE
jgi:hypothetical protein